MEKKEKFTILEKEKIDKNVYYYLKDLFNELNIEICDRYEGYLFDLMKKGKLEGWCWETTETAALFMPDDTIIYRGNLHFGKYNHYYHAFILFKYEDNSYVFDPCFCMINTTDLYFNVFNVDIKGYVSAKEIKEYFINYINNPPERKSYIDSKTASSVDRFMRKFFGDDYLEKKQNDIVIYDKEDPYAPMYRNNSGYKDINIDNDKIKSLTVHYYVG